MKERVLSNTCIFTNVTEYFIVDNTSWKRKFQNCSVMSTKLTNEKLKQKTLGCVGFLNIDMRSQLFMQFIKILWVRQIFFCFPFKCNLILLVSNLYYLMVLLECNQADFYLLTFTFFLFVDYFPLFYILLSNKSENSNFGVFSKLVEQKTLILKIILFVLKLFWDFRFRVFLLKVLYMVFPFT